ncbi:glucosamine-6-phosphate deaminase [Bacillus tianshenii]|uniref:glucosamine-6-phosphate deaminase n=1 Tax=Sutcliffiella tianshenii TaxID=1463404 RepID=UPI001CD1D083|nr:glucosamine-6-phosphate deaminase [Bacillus tianshenii]MCA1319094.1 glucosamine-6-phosphate deaminase [Bacillus tianshenii]
MDIITAPSYEAMSEAAANQIIDLVKHNPHSVLGLATGGTPTKMYELLIKDHLAHHTSYKNVTSFNLDEYAGLKKDHPNSYFSYMNQTLFMHLDIQQQHTFIPNGIAESLEKECARYDQLLQDMGPIDLQVLGLGENGHIGFNEPGTSFESETHIVRLTESTRHANARFFGSMDEVPTHAVTMGIKSIMKAKEILLLVSGENKKNALERLLDGPVSEDFPASILKKHPKVKIIADKSAYSRTNIIA